MINKKKIPLLLFLFCVYALQAQVQTNPPIRNVLATTGGTKVLPSGITIDYTVGECMVTTYTSGAPAIVRDLTQGFQQPLAANDTTKIISPLKFYTGITPNGDGENDSWKIDGIAAFPENKVAIFNRWGDKVWSGKNYDNVKVVWEGKTESGSPLQDATYFYVVELDGKKYKGWVELTK